MHPVVVGQFMIVPHTDPGRARMRGLESGIAPPLRIAGAIVGQRHSIMGRFDCAYVMHAGKSVSTIFVYIVAHEQDEIEVGLIRDGTVAVEFAEHIHAATGERDVEAVGAAGR